MDRDKTFLVSYTISDKVTFNIVWCFVDVYIPIEVATLYEGGIYDFLEKMYPMYNVYIENVS